MNEGHDAGEGISSDESGHRSNDMLGRSIWSNSSYVKKTLSAPSIHSGGDEGNTCKRDKYVKQSHAQLGAIHQWRELRERVRP